MAVFFEPTASAPICSRKPFLKGSLSLVTHSEDTSCLRGSTATSYLRGLSFFSRQAFLSHVRIGYSAGVRLQDVCAKDWAHSFALRKLALFQQGSLHLVHTRVARLVGEMPIENPVLVLAGVGRPVQSVVVVAGADQRDRPGISRWDVRSDAGPSAAEPRPPRRVRSEASGRAWPRLSRRSFLFFSSFFLSSSSRPCRRRRGPRSAWAGWPKCSLRQRG